MTKSASLRAAVVLALVLTSCGGSHKTTSTTKTGTTSHKKTHKPAAPTVLTETGGVAGASKFSPSITARPGQTVEFRTYVPGKSTSPAEDVTLNIPAGPAAKLTVTAKAHGQVANLVINSGTGKALKLLRVRYQCTLPPLPTFCPAKASKATPHGYQLKFSATHESGVLVSAIVGPVTLPTPKIAKPGSSVVPPYTARELLRARAATAKVSPTSKLPPATPSVKASPGDLLSMYTQLKGILGALQPVTVTINQGPAKTITISAHASGGPPSGATVKSASGSPITIVLARYNCYVPPTPTFCPAARVAAPPHRYSLTFMAAPGTATIEIQAKVEAG